MSSASWLCHVFFFFNVIDECPFSPCQCCTSRSYAFFSLLACCRISAQLHDFGSFCLCNTTSVALSLKSSVVTHNLPCIVGLCAIYNASELRFTIFTTCIRWWYADWCGSCVRWTACHSLSQQVVCGLFSTVWNIPSLMLRTLLDCWAVERWVGD